MPRSTGLILLLSLSCAALDARRARYWQFSCNELGQQDIAAQIEHIHHVKTAELRMTYGESAGGGAATAGLPEDELSPCTLPYDSLGDGCGLFIPNLNFSLLQKPDLSSSSL